jgi:hypothetical protein
MSRSKKISSSAPVVCGIQLQECSDDLRHNLLKIKSPFCEGLKVAVSLLKDKRHLPAQERAEILVRAFKIELFLSRQDINETIFVFINEQERVAALLKKGKEDFRRAVEAEVRRKLPLKVCDKLTQAAAKLFIERACNDADRLQSVMN